MESDMFLHIIKTPAIPHMLSQENTYHMQSICYCWCIVIYFCSSIYLVADMFLHIAPTTPHKLAQGEDDGSARSKKMGRADQCQDIWNWTSQLQANTVKYRHVQLTQIQIQ